MDRDETKQRLIETHESYDEYYLVQRVIELDAGESITITTKDAVGKILEEEIFTAEQINCHFNFWFQDKGEKNTQQVIFPE